MNPNSVIFCGTPEFAVPSLQAIIDDPAFTVTLVITQPDKPVGRKQTITPPPVKVLAQAHDIPVAQPENIIEIYDQLSAENYDFLIAVAYGQIIPEKVLSMPKIAPVNLHPSLLPRWRGASPIQHAILKGDSETGVTIQLIVKQLDTGPILAQEFMKISKDVTTPILFETLAKIGSELLVQTLKKPLKPKEQNEENVTICKKLSRKNGEVTPKNMTAEEIDRKVRALVPWPGVQCEIEGHPVKLLQTSLTPSSEDFALTCAKGSILFIKLLQTPGGKPMSGNAWERGHSK